MSIQVLFVLVWAALVVAGAMDVEATLVGVMEDMEVDAAMVGVIHGQISTTSFVS